MRGRGVKSRCLVTVIALVLSPASLACSVSATSFHFGSIDPLMTGDTSSASDITVQCPDITSYTIALSQGAGSYGERRMVSGSEELIYNLYVDASHSAIWGDGTGTSQTVEGTADGSGTVHTVHGRVPHQGNAVPGNYTDAIVVTVTF